MSAVRRLKAWALNHELNPSNIRANLAAAAVPLSDAPCRTCADPCDAGHEEYPPRFKVDMETQMLGSVRPFRRQIMISTGATDWDREITNKRGSLAALVASAHYKSSAAPAPSGNKAPRVPGIFPASESAEIAILNGSHASVCEDPALETVLVFPDYVAVAGVPSDAGGVQVLWKNALDPGIPRVLGSRDGGSRLKTWVLPYATVITMCSHKRRDNRCALSAPKLERAFIESLERRGWSVDTQLEHFLDPPLEKFQGTADEREEHVVGTLKRLHESKRALILYNSHMGGHRYAGNCIIYTPSGTCVWYGRLTPHDVDSIVENTIVGGLVLPTLLRGGLGLSKPGGKTLHEW